MNAVTADRMEGRVTVENGWYRLDFNGTAHAAHWERYGGCSWGLTVRAFAGNANKLQIDTAERGSKSEKRTMISMSKDQALALRDFLCHAYGPPERHEENT